MAVLRFMMSLEALRTNTPEQMASLAYVACAKVQPTSGYFTTTAIVHDAEITITDRIFEEPHGVTLSAQSPPKKHIQDKIRYLD